MHPPAIIHGTTTKMFNTARVRAQNRRNVLSQESFVETNAMKLAKLRFSSRSWEGKKENRRFYLLRIVRRRGKGPRQVVLGACVGDEVG